MIDWNVLLNSILDELQHSSVNTLGLTSVALAIVPAFLLALCIGAVYRTIQRNSAYSASFVQALVLFAPMVATLFLVIGNNLARAFGMMGALNLVRFRHALKSPMDTIYLFWSLAVGVACGAHFYFAATLLTLICAFIAVFLHYIGWGDSSDGEGIVKFSLASEVDEKVLSEVERYLQKESRLCRKVNTLFDSETRTTMHVYLVRPKKNTPVDKLSHAIQSMSGVTRVFHLSGPNTPVLVS